MEIKVLASGSSGNCYYISDGITPLLLECGIRFTDIQRKLNFRVSEIAGCLSTHEHLDHCRAMQDMLKAGVDCYMSHGTADAIGVSSHHRVHIIKAREQFKIGTWTILGFETVHDSVGSLGFLLANKAGEKLLFVTDTAYIPVRFKGLSYLMVEANFSLEILNRNVASGVTSSAMKRLIMSNHMSLETLVEMLKSNDLSKIQEIWLLHLSDKNSDAELFKRTIQEVVGVPVYIA